MSRRPPEGHLRLSLPGKRAVLMHRRSMLVCGVLLVIGLVMATVTTMTGVYEIAPSRVLAILRGANSGTDAFLLLEQRLPRVIAAALVGAALAASGAIFQSLSRNPLGSPDLIGFTTGAASGGLVTILLFGSPSTPLIAAGTLMGGLVTALAVIALNRGAAQVGDRLIVGGIAIAAMASAINDFLLSRADIQAAEVAKAWQHGSLNAITWPPVALLAITLTLLLPAALCCTHVLRFMELGDDLAAGLGVSLARARTAALLVGVALSGVAVAAAGPISFIALIAPQLTRRLTKAPGIALLPTMAMGTVVLLTGNLLAQRLLSPFQIPVGLVTAALGGGYLTWLLTRPDHTT